MPAFKKVKKSSGGQLTLNETLITHVCNSMRAGAYIETAAAFAGVHKNTLHSWMKKGREDQAARQKDPTSQEPISIFEQLIVAVDRVQAEAEIRDLFNIDVCAMGQNWEYERYPEGSVDGNGKDRSGELVLNGKGNPIVKKIGIPPDWHASAWRLERRHAGRWNRVQKLEMEDPSVIPAEETEEQKQERKNRLREKARKLLILDEE